MAARLTCCASPRSPRQHASAVIDPYLKYPNLLGILITFLKTEQQLSIRRETMKVLGVLGALDPYKHTVRSGPSAGAIPPTACSQSVDVAGQRWHLNRQAAVTDRSPVKTANGFGSDNNLSADLSTEQLLMNMSPSNEDYYPTVVINALMKILRDPSLSAHHNAVTQVRPHGAER